MRQKYQYLRVLSTSDYAMPKVLGTPRTSTSEYAMPKLQITRYAPYIRVR